MRQWHGRMNRSELSANTVAKVYRMFRTIMATAIEDRFLRSNPVTIKGAATERVAERPLLDWDDIERLGPLPRPAAPGRNGGGDRRRLVARGGDPDGSPVEQRCTPLPEDSPGRDCEIADAIGAKLAIGKSTSSHTTSRDAIRLAAVGSQNTHP